MTRAKARAGEAGQPIGMASGTGDAGCQPLPGVDGWYFTIAPTHVNPAPTHVNPAPTHVNPAPTQGDNGAQGNGLLGDPASAVSGVGGIVDGDGGSSRPTLRSVEITFAIAGVLEPRVLTIGPDGVDGSGVASIRTPAGWTLVAATAEIVLRPDGTGAPAVPTATGPVASATTDAGPGATSNGDAGQGAAGISDTGQGAIGATDTVGASGWSLVLAGTCPGQVAAQILVPVVPPMPRPARRSAVTAPAESGSATASEPTPTGAGSAGFAATAARGDLPRTGPDISGMLTLGMSLFAAGALLLIVRRQRQRPAPRPEPTDWY